MRTDKMANDDSSSTLKQDFDNAANASGKAMEQGKEKAKEKVNDVANQIKENFNDIQHNFVNCVKENPYVSLGVSFLVGMLITAMMKK